MRDLIRITIGILLLAIPASAYVTSRVRSAVDGSIVQARWKTEGFPIEWKMNPTVGSNVTGGREQAEIFRAAFQAWTALPTANSAFREGSAAPASTLPGNDGINLITTNLTASQWAQLGGGGAIALTLVTYNDAPDFVDAVGRRFEFAGHVLEADIFFNPAMTFSTSATAVADRFDLQSVATHEVGHFLGLDHTTIVGATMFWTIGRGQTYARTLTADDVSGISSIYPTGAFSSKGSITGTVRNASSQPVYGAVVVAVNANGVPISSAVTNPEGRYTIAGLDAGTYTLYAEPLDQPIQVGNIPTLTQIHPGSTVVTNFTTRYR